MLTEHHDGAVDIDPSRAAVFRPTGTVVMTTSDDYDSVAVKIEPRVLEDALEEIPGRPVPRALEMEPSFDLDAAGAGWARLVDLLATESHPDGLAGSEIVAAPLREAVVHGLLRAVGHPYRDALDAPAPSFAPVAPRRVVDAVEADPAATTVSRVARRWGFIHTSRFAATYQARYRVAPSTTLRGRPQQ
jgi:AraC-like DNA-binding protein